MLYISLFKSLFTQIQADDCTNPTLAQGMDKSFSIKLLLGFLIFFLKVNDLHFPEFNGMAFTLQGNITAA